jgi:hypothetical protein
MEEAAEAESKKATTSYRHLPELPKPIKVMVSDCLLTGHCLSASSKQSLMPKGGKTCGRKRNSWQIITSDGQ